MSSYSSIHSDCSSKEKSFREINEAIHSKVMHKFAEKAIQKGLRDSFSSFPVIQFPGRNSTTEEKEEEEKPEEDIPSPNNRPEEDEKPSNSSSAGTVVKGQTIALQIDEKGVITGLSSVQTHIDEQNDLSALSVKGGDSFKDSGEFRLASANEAATLNKGLQEGKEDLGFSYENTFPSGINVGDVRSKLYSEVERPNSDSGVKIFEQLRASHLVTNNETPSLGPGASGSISSVKLGGQKIAAGVTHIMTLTKEDPMLAQKSLLVEKNRSSAEGLIAKAKANQKIKTEEARQSGNGLLIFHSVGGGELTASKGMIGYSFAVMKQRIRQFMAQKGGRGVSQGSGNIVNGVGITAAHVVGANPPLGGSSADIAASTHPLLSVSNLSQIA